MKRAHQVDLEEAIEKTNRGARRVKPQRGTCTKCGCTDDNACEGGCSWVNARHTLCSRCVAPRRARFSMRMLELDFEVGS